MSERPVDRREDRVGGDGVCGDGVAVQRTVELDAPVADVWAALTDDDALSAWFGGRVTLDPVPGGSGRFEEGDGEVRRARVDDVEPGRRLSFRWWAEGDDDGPITSVTFELTELDDATRLVVTERALLVGSMRASASIHGDLRAGLDRRWAGMLARLVAWTPSLARV